MDKEEIEDIKAELRILHQVLLDEHREGTYTIQRILEYINCLERRESILDKVTDKLKELEIELKNDGYDYYEKEIQKMLNIIKGEKNDE